MCKISRTVSSCQSIIVNEYATLKMLGHLNYVYSSLKLKGASKKNEEKIKS